MTASTLQIYTPSGVLAKSAPLTLAAKRLKALGFDVQIDEAARARHQRFGGDDATRLAALHRVATAAPDIALATRGGYGMTRLLDYIDWALLGRSIERGTRWVGHSDLTVLQLGLLAQRKSGSDAIAWAGPMACDDFGRSDDLGGVDEVTRDCFVEAMSGVLEAVGFRTEAGLGRSSGDRRGLGGARLDAKELDARKIDAKELDSNELDEGIHGGGLRAKELDGLEVRGLLWGGNLCMVNSLLGTKYFPRIKGGVLFLEDVNEHPYRIERNLLQLHQAGVLDAQKAVVLGEFSAWRKVPLDRGFTMKSVVRHLRSVTKTPILTGLPFGHVPTKVTMPVGARVRLLVDGRNVLIGWD